MQKKIVFVVSWFLNIKLEVIYVSVLFEHLQHILTILITVIILVIIIVIRIFHNVTSLPTGLFVKGQIMKAVMWDN